MTPRTIVLLAGPSGSGKSRLAARSGCPRLRLDDFYRDGDDPSLPRAHGVVDWDDPATWDADAALAAMRTLVEIGRADMPRYSIPDNRAVSRQTLDLGDAGCFVAEGIFAIDIAPRMRAAGLPVRAIYLDRPRPLTFVLRLKRDLKEKRKPPAVLVRRGLALMRHESSLRVAALAAGFEPMSMSRARSVITELHG